MSNKERAEFEVWATAQRFINVPFGGTGVLPTVASIEMSWQASGERYQSRIAELEDVADKLYQSLQEVLQMQVNGHDLQDLMQFSMPGRAIGGKSYAARKLYEAMKGGA